MKALTKTELISLWRHMEFHASKKMGQNFIVDSNIRDKIIGLIEPKPGDRILEIGPGFGEMTLPLLEKAAHVTAVDKDRRICEALKKNILKGKQNIEIVNADILEYDIVRNFDKVVGNLPYYISTPIIEKLLLLDYRPDIYIMVQEEYALRMSACAGDNDYSSLSCFIQYNSVVKKLASVRRECFFPEPGVDSVFLSIKARGEPCVKVKDKELFWKVIRASFNQRRKTLRASLCGQGIVPRDKHEFADRLQSLGINKDARPEEMSLKEFAAITDEISEMKGQ